MAEYEIVGIHVPSTLFNVEEFDDAMDQVLHKIAWEAEDFWRTLAGQRLKTTRAAYQSAIKTTGTSTKGTISLVLDGGFLPWAVEQGTGSYTMNVKRGQLVPMNMNRQIIFTSPSAWVTGTGEAWKHPGFPGMRMLDDVIEEIQDVIAPKHIMEALEVL
jgi:hypothetical protein